MAKKEFSLNYKVKELIKLAEKTSQKTLAFWAIKCVERVMPYFEKEYPKDERPRRAIETLKEWIKTGVFSMKVIRKASLDSHAAAREVGEDNSARSAARAAGQCVATAHVKTHSVGAAIYSLQAVYRGKGIKAVDKEREWQYKELIKLKKKGIKN